MDGIRLKHVLEFKFLGCVLEEAGTYGAECCRNMASGRRVAGAIRSLVVRDLKLECARVLHETLLVPVLTYDSKTMLWKEKERSRIRALQMNNHNCLLDIRRMDRVSNARIRELYGVKRGLDERIDSVIWRGWRRIVLLRESM